MDRQRAFDEANGLGFPLLSDPERKVQRQFGVRRPGRLPGRRATFVVDADRRLVRAIRSETSMTVHADEALEALREL